MPDDPVAILADIFFGKKVEDLNETERALLATVVAMHAGEADEELLEKLAQECPEEGGDETAASSSRSRPSTAKMMV